MGDLASQRQEASQAVINWSAEWAESLGTRDFPRAIEIFSQAIRVDPSFAEAYNQRAIAYYLSEDYQRSIADCRRAINGHALSFRQLQGSRRASAPRENGRPLVKPESAYKNLARPKPVIPRRAILLEAPVPLQPQLT